METTTRIDKSQIIIFEFKVFRYDTLFGAIVIYDNKAYYYQTWQTDDIKRFYEANKDTMWIGHNNEECDNIILQAVLKNNPDIYSLSKSLKLGKTPNKLYMKLFYIDLMKIYGRQSYTLEMAKGACGRDISEDDESLDTFNALTNEEKQIAEICNRDDLNQIFYDYKALKDEIGIRVDICKEFHIGIGHIMDTYAQLAALILGAKRIPSIEGWKCEPNWHDDLRIKNQPIIEYKDSYDDKDVPNTTIRKFYLSEEFKKGMHYAVKLCGDTIIGGSGGMHSAKNRNYFKDALYCDVSGFYNLIMINKGLLPRTLGDDGRRLYTYCYEEQLRLKKTNPKKRKTYKAILLAVFGSMKNKFTDFYDPNKCHLVMITGQLYIIDLLQKLGGKATLVQANTDGIIVQPNDWNSREEVVKIVREWEERTKFTIKIEEIHNVWQKDVNCYMYNDNEGNLHVVGENAVYNDWDNIFDRGMWTAEEPPILAKIIVDFLTKGTSPKETVESCKDEPRMFQYLCKKGTYDYLLYEEKDNWETSAKSEEFQNICRVFALKSDDSYGMVYKVKNAGNKRARVSSLPDNVFVYNKDIQGNPKDLMNRIDYDFYVKRGTDKICSFVPKEWVE